MNATTQVARGTLLSSLVGSDERERSLWTVAAIGVLALALAAMAVQPAIPQRSGAVEEIASSLIE
jgi:hypothetical protein